MAGRKEDLQAKRHAIAQESHHADDECNVRPHRDSPSRRTFPAKIESRVDKRRYQNAPDGPKDWERSVPWGREFAYQQFALDL